MIAKKKSTSTESDNGTFIISRVFDAPREAVFQAYTESERLEKWWGAKGFTTNVKRLDFRPDGIFHYRMLTPDGHEMYGKFVYRNIVAPEQLVFISTFADEKGNPIRAPFSATWPMEILNTTTYSEDDGQTTVTIRSVPVNATEEERKTFESMFDSMQQGYGETLDRLADYLTHA